jgi:LacI family transcriptional regulator
MKRKNVALIVETSGVYGREILKGIARFRNTHDPWSVYLDERELNTPPPEWLLDWDGDGVICRSTTPELAEGLRSKGLAVVDLNDRHGDLGFPRVSSDMVAIGKTAAWHLLDRDFSSIAYCGFEGEPWCDSRLAGLQEVVTPVSVFRTSWRGLREHAWKEEQNLICEWLRDLPRPLGVIACNDIRGHHVLDACKTLGLSVPEEVAVIGVDNASTFCALCDPPLSSVVPDAEGIGYRAATLLDQAMRGIPIETSTISMGPKGVVVRESTDSVAISDPVVARACRFIRENSSQGIGVQHVLSWVGVSRSTLERRFRSALGCSPHDEMIRSRIARVKVLLRDTHRSIRQIAEDAGFEHPEYLMVQFKRETGKTPTQWRLQPEHVRHLPTEWHTNHNL